MIKLSFKNPYLIVVLASVLIPRMPVDILPQFKKSAMQILTLYPGMPAEVVQEMYIQSQLDYLQAVTAYNQAQYRMYVALGNSL